MLASLEIASLSLMVSCGLLCLVTRLWPFVTGVLDSTVQ